MTYQFYFDNLDSPTQFNLDKHLRLLGWESKAPGDFNDSHLCLHEAYSQLLEYKHVLASWAPNHLIPKTYSINDSNYVDVLLQIQEQGLSDNYWILKPSLLNNGQGIVLFDHSDQLYDHYLTSNRYGGEHVLQQYIINPHLLNGHKYTFRMFVVLTNFAGAYLYKDGYFNVARSPYTPSNVNDLHCHLTNEHLAANEGENNWQIPTTRCPNFSVIYKKMLAAVSKTLEAFYQQAPDLHNAQITKPVFSLFGFDFILDENLKLWLLEVNHGPCFPKDDHHLLQKHLYCQFWRDIINDFVQHIAAPNSNFSYNTERFDHVY